MVLMHCVSKFSSARTAKSWFLIQIQHALWQNISGNVDYGTYYYSPKPLLGKCCSYGEKGDIVQNYTVIPLFLSNPWHEITWHRIHNDLYSYSHITQIFISHCIKLSTKMLKTRSLKFRGTFHRVQRYIIHSMPSYWKEMTDLKHCNNNTVRETCQ